MKKGFDLRKHHNALILGLNGRMAHCQECLAEIAIQKDLKILDDQAFFSEILGKHFSIPAYKAMKSALDKIVSCPEYVSFGYFTSLELIQMIKAVGALHSDHAELTNFLVDNLVCAIYNERKETL